MTVQSQTSFIGYDGPGSVFAIPFRFLADTDIRITKALSDGTSQTLVLTTDYTLVGARQQSGGTATLVAALLADERIVIDRGNMQLTQLTDYRANDPFPEEAAEDIADRGIMLLQQGLLDGSARSLRLSPVDIDGSGTYQGNGNRIADIADAVDPTDVPTLAQVTGLIGPGSGPFIQAGTGAVIRTYQAKDRDIVSVKDFGAIGDGVVDDVAKIQAALDAGVGGRVLLPKGSYKVSSQINVPADTILDGDGTQAILIPSATIGSMVRLTGNNAVVRGCQFLNSGGLATAGVTIGSDFCTVEGNYFANMKRAVQIDGSQALRIVQNTMIGQDFGVFVIDDGRNSVIENCHIQGGTCIWVDKVSIQNEGLRVNNCFLAPNVTADANSGHGIVINGGLEFEIYGNIIDNIDKYGLYLTGVYTTEAVKCIGNWFGADATVAGSSCVHTEGPIKQLQLLGNTFTGADNFGVNIDYVSGGKPNGFDISHNRFYGNDTGDLRMDGLLFSTVIGNQFNSSSISIAEQDNTSSVTVMGNVFTVAPSFKSSLSQYKDNQGPAGVNTNYGTYTPTLTNATNVSSSTAYVCQWAQVGDVVTVSGRVDITPTAGATLTTLRMSLPVPSDIGNLNDVGGACIGLVNPIVFGVGGDGATDTAVFQTTPSLTGSQPCSFTFTYRVI